MRRVRMQLVSLLLLACFDAGAIVQADAGGVKYLERGQRGIVPCPLSVSCSRPRGSRDVDAVYWHYGSRNARCLLISYFLGRVAPQNGIPEGVYDIDNECNLIIKNVTASNEGTFYYKVKPHLKSIKEGQITVVDKVSPSQPHPTVLGCNQDYDSDKCEVRVPHDSTVHNLTCVMEQVKPAVELRWLLGGQTELQTFTTVRLVVLTTNTGPVLRNNTYSTSASVQVPSVDSDVEYVCEAVGVAVGGRPTRTRVRLTKTHPTPATYDTTTNLNVEVQSSNNPETTQGLADYEGKIPQWGEEVSPVSMPINYVGLLVAVVVLSIVLLASCVALVIVRVRMYRKRQRGY